MQARDRMGIPSSIWSGFPLRLLNLIMPRRPQPSAFCRLVDVGAEGVQPFPAFIPATGATVDTSLPSIRGTRPCDADNRAFSAS